jgi:hypothetical protein
MLVFKSPKPSDFNGVGRVHIVGRDKTYLPADTIVGEAILILCFGIKNASI